MYEKVQTLSPLEIATGYLHPVKAPGLAGVALLQPGTATGLKAYHMISEVEDDFEVGTYPYNFAEKYFSNINSPLFQVITAGPTDVTSASAPTGVTATPTSDGANVTANTASGTPATSSDADNMIAAITKYYGAGAEYFVLPVTEDNHDTVVAVSNFIEAQDLHVLLLDISTEDSAPDLSFLSAILGNKSTLAMSLVKYGDTDADYQLTSTFLAEYANSAPGRDPEFVHDLDDVVPQPEYEFTKADLDKYYTPYNVLTYAYRNGIPMFTSNKSLSGDQFSVMIVRDAITTEITTAITNLFVNNSRIPYNDVGIAMFKGQIKLVLDAYVDKGLINDDYTIDAITAAGISDNQKASGVLTGMGWKYEPVFTVDHVKFAQTIVLPIPQAA